jgi:hypothetical protein
MTTMTRSAAPGAPSVADAEAVPPPAAPRPAAETINRKTSPLTVEDVARRVYELFCEELRRDRERRGCWW